MVVQKANLFVQAKMVHIMLTIVHGRNILYGGCGSNTSTT